MRSSPTGAVAFHGQAGLTSPSAGTPVLVDVNGVASSGTVSVLDLKLHASIAELEVGLHPAGMALAADAHRLFVANANSDTVSVIDTNRLRQIETIPVSPEPGIPFGSEPSALAVDRGQGPFTSRTVGDAIGIFDVANKRMRGFVPTAWYPGQVVLDTGRNRLYVANVKGFGSFGIERGYSPNFIKHRKGGKNAYDYAGSVSVIAIPDNTTLAVYTKDVGRNLTTGSARVSTTVPAHGLAVPLPASLRQQSVFKHVIYIIKENRTYDEVLGDMKQGDGDASLCMFCGDVTPDHHALAEQFVLFDNFYVNGQLSADGHQWTDEGIATDYVEKTMGGFSRSYPSDGTDPLAYSPAGFIWGQPPAAEWADVPELWRIRGVGPGHGTEERHLARLLFRLSQRYPQEQISATHICICTARAHQPGLSAVRPDHS